MPNLRFTTLLFAAALAASTACAAAQQAFAPMTKDASGQTVAAESDATLWLALASVAMVATLYAAHWSIFRRK